MAGNQDTLVRPGGSHVQKRAPFRESGGATASLLRLRIVLGLFIFALVISGVTAFPLQNELNWLTTLRGVSALQPGEARSGLDLWLLTVRDGLKDTYARYTWVGYGTDWLAFAHIIIALFFVGPFLDPRRNVWVLKAGLMACALVIPLALICGTVRGIPFGWRLLDCSFGVFGSLPLWYGLRVARRLENQSPSHR